MKILIDMNLSPEWVAVFARNEWEALHWSAVGDPYAADHTLMDWARANGYTIFTHDLDFGAILAVTQAEGPSVIQVRTQDVTPVHLEGMVLNALRQNSLLLEDVKKVSSRSSRRQADHCPSGSRPDTRS